MNLNQFRNDKEIDPTQLDVECVRQADRTFHWAQASILASAEEDRAKLDLEILESKLEMDCRDNPLDYGLVRITEGGIKAAIRIHDKRVAAFKHWIEAKRQSRILTAAVSAMETKKRMLQGLITLHGQQYFAGPSVPRDLIAEWKEHQEKVGQNVNARQRARTRKRKGS